jgi:hypothetical protein
MLFKKPRQSGHANRAVKSSSLNYSQHNFVASKPNSLGINMQAHANGYFRANKLQSAFPTLDPLPSDPDLQLHVAKVDP